MLRTFAAPFDFHSPNGGRRDFEQFASAFSGRFDCQPQIISDPIFSYTKRGRRQLDQLRELDEARPAIVFLSNVVMHSAILIMGACEASELESPISYESLACFYNHPVSLGYGVDRSNGLRSTFDDTTVAISEFYKFRDDQDELPEDEIFRVLNKINDVYVCNILNYDRYFSEALTCGDQPFFLNAGASVDLQECIRHFDECSLRQYLLARSVSFATIGDDHMDDEYAVSYGMSCWKFTDSDLAFAR